MEEENKFYKIFQIPKARKQMKQAYISLIDSSASMWHNWERLAKNFNKYVPK